MNPACATRPNVKPIISAPADIKQAGSGNICHAIVPVHNAGLNLKHTVARNAGHANVKHVHQHVKM